MLEDLQAALKHVQKYRWWYGSGVFHILLIAIIYFIGPYELHKERRDIKKAEAQSFVKKAYKKDVDRKLNDIRKIEDVMDRMQNKNDSSKEENDENQKASNSSNSEPNSPEAPSAHSSLSEETIEKPLGNKLLEAQELLKKLQEINTEVNAEQLARLADMPLEKALEEMKNATPELERFAPSDLEKMSDSEVRNAMSEYHEKARKYLEEAVKHEEKERQGHSVSLTPGLNPGLNPGAQSSGKSNKGGEGKSKGESTGEGNTGNGPNGNSSGPSMSALAEAHSLLQGSGSGGNESGSGEGTANFEFDPNSRVNNARPIELVPSPQNRVAGRTIGAGGALADRVYLDTWYMIGPFDYYGRHMRDNPHPPELDVDLDAVYMGKGGRFIHWEYYQSSGYPLVPRDGRGDATYYGYTEVNFDEPTTAMLAMGCDDDCTVWVNDKLAWKSGEAFKPWYIGGGYPVLENDVANWSLIEDYKKVDFPKGTTRIKFRLDNGYSLLFFALSIEKMRF